MPKEHVECTKNTIFIGVCHKGTIRKYIYPGNNIMKHYVLMLQFIPGDSVRTEKGEKFSEKDGFQNATSLETVMMVKPVKKLGQGQEKTKKMRKMC